MLLSAVIYVTAVTALLTGAAWILESAVKGRDIPTRFIWAFVICAAIASLGVALGVDRAETGLALGAPAVVAVELSDVGAAATEVMLGEQLTAPPALTMTRRANAWLWATWSMLSGLLLVLVCNAHVRLHLERRRWSSLTVGGKRVLVSEKRGPAVIGVARPVVVIPHWLLDMTEAQQGLMLRHEQEHRAAGDSRLVAAAVASLVLVPWNLPLWWVVSRLRVALEIDCDRRVLRTAPDIRPYASLLVDIGARAKPSRLAAVGFSSSFHFLERRIKAMTDSHPRAAFRAAALAAVATLLIAGACYVDRVDVTISDDTSSADVVAERADLLEREVRALTDTISGLLRNFAWMNRKVASRLRPNNQ